jgi:4'-phosphopantetheinyl transferase
MIQISPPPLIEGEAHVWLAELDRSPAEQEELAQHLSPEEQQRAARFINSRHRMYFAAGRGLLRVILAAYLSALPHKIQFTYGKQGKPYLDDPSKTNLHFNISHSGKYILIAIALTNEVGVDIEEIHTIENLETISRRYFSSQEFQTINTLPPQEQVNAFFTCWTRKEAFIKACGDGFAIPLDSFSVSLGPEESEPLLLDNTSGKVLLSGWYIIPLSPAQGYTGALAVQGHYNLHYISI